MQPIYRRLVGAAIGLVILVVLLRQCRKPSGWPGRLILQTMNRRHSAVTDWGLGHVSIAPHDTILDAGCGGGRTIQKLASVASSGKVVGIDYSAASVAGARRLNADAVREGRVEVFEASVSQLPLPANTFDLVTAVETHYYWPDPANDLRELLRVLKPGGRLLLIAETYKGQTFGALLAIPMMLLRARYLTIREHEELLRAAGFTDVAIDTAPVKGWICCVAQKP